MSWSKLSKTEKPPETSPQCRNSAINTVIMTYFWSMISNSLSEKKVHRKNSSTHLTICIHPESRSSYRLISRRKILKLWRPDFVRALSGVWLLIFHHLIMKPVWRFYRRRLSWIIWKNTIFRMMYSNISQRTLRQISENLKGLLINWLLFINWTTPVLSILPLQQRP